MLDAAELCISLDPVCAAGWLAWEPAEEDLGRAVDAAVNFQTSLLVSGAQTCGFIRCSSRGLRLSVRSLYPPSADYSATLFPLPGTAPEIMFRTAEDPVAAIRLLGRGRAREPVQSFALSCGEPSSG